MANDNSTAVSGSVGHADRHWLFQGLGLTAVIIVLALVFTWMNPRFASVANLANVLTQASHIIIIAVAMTFVITSAGIDLSVGSLLALVTVIGFALIKGGMHPLLGVMVMFGLGAAIGCLTGTLIALVKIPPFIATLGMMVSSRRRSRTGHYRNRFCTIWCMAVQPHQIRPARARHRRKSRSCTTGRCTSELDRNSGLRIDGPRDGLGWPHHDSQD